MKIKAISVVEVDCGIPHNIVSFDSFDEASEHFKGIVTRVEEENDNTVSDEELNDMVDNGVFTSEGYDLYLMVCEG